MGELQTVHVHEVASTKHFPLVYYFPFVPTLISEMYQTDRLMVVRNRIGNLVS